MKLMIVTGRSGSGKSICLHVLEDLDFYCIDNLPAGLLPAMVEQLRGKYERVAVSIDVRNPSDHLQQLPQTIQDLEHCGVQIQLLFVDASTETIIKRYNATRRKHPLCSASVSLADALAEESTRLVPISDRLDLFFDTSQMSIHEFRHHLVNRLHLDVNRPPSLLLTSFGFKYGIPLDQEYLFDVRFLPNPFWHRNLAAATGRDSEVAHFLEQHSETGEIIQEIAAFLSKWAPRFFLSNRRYLNVGIGCTGGQHRSVYVVEQLGKCLASCEGFSVQMRHRELP